MRVMNDTYTTARCLRAASMTRWTRSAPASSSRRASRADVSNTYRAILGITPPVTTTVRQQLLDRSTLSGSSEGCQRIVGERNHAHRVPLDNPLQRRVRGDAE